MFIKLTRLDHSEIWINASFVVMVEPRKGGGSVVVPIGDGLDYDVMESPEAVLALLADAPAHKAAPAAAPQVLGDEQIARLRKFAPRSVRKLQNTLASQFSVPDLESALKTLQAQGVLSLEGNHIVWAS